MFVAPAYAQTGEGISGSQPDATPGAADELPVEGSPVGDDLLNTEIVIADEAHEGTFPPFDSSTYASQLVWLALTFGLFYLFLQKVVLPRITGILETRRDRIAQDLEQAARLKQQADEALAAYEQELAEGRANAARIGQEARDNAKADADAQRRAVEAELEQKLSGAEERINSIKASAMSEVGSIAADTVASIVDRLLGVKVTEAEAANAVKSVRN